jgi:hypothetical protein
VNEFNENFSDLSKPGAYSRKALRYIHGDHKDLIKQLRKNETYSLHKSVRKKFKRRKIVVEYPGQILQMDLVDMIKFSRQNSHYKYVINCIDLFSKKLWSKPIKQKTGKEVTDAIKSMFAEMEYPPQTIIFDEGKEFLNKYVDRLFANYNIHSYSILTEKKAGAVERVNRTIKSIMWKYFTEKKTKRWVDILPEVVNNYNSTFHTSIKMSPNSVTWDNRKTVYKALYPDIKLRTKCKLKVGDNVRIALKKDIFEKGYTQSWSKEIYKIQKVFQRNRVCWYRLVDQGGKRYPKYKYYQQLNLVS